MSGEIDRRQQQVREALTCLRQQKKEHRPRKGGGFHDAVAVFLNAEQDVLTHDHCSTCSAAIIKVKNQKVSIECSQGYIPVDLWTDFSRQPGEEPSCIAYQPVEDIIPEVVEEPLLDDSKP